MTPDSPDSPIVTLWHIAVSAEASERAWSLLSEPDRQRAQRFHRVQDQQRSAVTRAAMRQILGDAIEITAGPYGKPETPAQGIAFNAAHSGDWAWIAVTADIPVGIDLERIREIDDMSALMETHAAPSELDAFRLTPPPRQTETFFTWWTRKEAYLKGIGIGLHDDLRDVIAWSGARGPQNVNGWCVASIESPPGYCGALAVAAPAFRVDARSFRWS